MKTAWQSRLNKEVEKVEYSQLLASDIWRDGLGLELWDGDDHVAEIFRSDRERTLAISLWREDIPLEIIEEFIADARRRLLPFNNYFSPEEPKT